MSNLSGLGRREFLGLGGALALGGLLGSPSKGFAQAALKPVNIIHTAGTTTDELDELMRTQGFLGQMGLAPEFLNVADGSKVVGALMGGTSDICIWSGFGQIFSAIEGGAKIKLLAGACLAVEFAVYAKRPEIKSLKDLEGKTVGTGPLGTLLHQLMVAMFEKAGVDVSKVTFANAGGAVEVFKAVSAGTVDAGPGPAAFFNHTAQYGVHALSDGAMWSEVPEYTFQGAYTTADTIASKRDALVRTLAAYAKLYRLVQNPGSKDVFVKARVAAVKGDPALVAAEAADEWDFCQQYKPYAVDLLLTPQRVEYMQRLNLKLGLQKTLLPFDQVADMSLAQEALKLIG